MLLTETEEVSLSGGQVIVGKGQASPGKVSGNSKVSGNTTLANDVDGMVLDLNTEGWLELVDSIDILSY